MKYYFFMDIAIVFEANILADVSWFYLILFQFVMPHLDPLYVITQNLLWVLVAKRSLVVTIKSHYYVI